MFFTCITTLVLCTDSNPHQNGATAQSPDEMGALRCVGVLPGLGHYDTDTSSDTDDSSDLDEVCINIQGTWQ